MWRKFKKIIKLKSFLVAFMIFILIVSGAIWQEAMVCSEEKQYLPVGDLVNVGSYNMHYHSKGEGNIAIVFIAGSGTPCAYTDFYQLQNFLSDYGQTVSFDHAGFGWSTESSAERDVDSLVGELNILIDETIPRDSRIILICHSLSSLEAIRYTQKYTEKVIGVVFLDGGSPEFYRKDSELSSTILNRAGSILRVTGFARLLGEFGALLPLYGEDERYPALPEEIRPLDKAMYYRFMGNATNMGVLKQINENAKAILSAENIGDIPILVLSSDSGDEWQNVQIQLSAWSTNSTQITIKDSNHYIHWSNFDEVSRLIKEFVVKVS